MNRVQICRGARRIFAVAMTMAMLTVCTAPSPAQQKDKKKKNTPPPADNNSGNHVSTLTDEQQIDYLISEVLGFWQVGDTERMHKDYSEDVSVVNGGFAPPILGWANYETLYKQQREKMQQVRMDRGNTYIKVNGNTAWACFQWDFAAVIDGNQTAARGQTTYVFVKRDNHWLIAHDHTSVVQTLQPQPPAQAPPASPAAPTKP
ncbi:MAG TPA: nuclear transport factor 2 family protein [Candidatus Acidoferrum sp.]